MGFFFGNMKQKGDVQSQFSYFSRDFFVTALWDTRPPPFDWRFNWAARCSTRHTLSGGPSVINATELNFQLLGRIKSNRVLVLRQGVFFFPFSPNFPHFVTTNSAFLHSLASAEESRKSFANKQNNWIFDRRSKVLSNLLPTRWYHFLRTCGTCLSTKSRG